MEIVIVYNVCKDAEPRNQRGSGAKALGLGRREYTAHDDLEIQISSC